MKYGQSLSERAIVPEVKLGRRLDDSVAQNADHCEVGEVFLREQSWQAFLNVLIRIWEELIGGWRDAEILSKLDSWPGDSGIEVTHGRLISGPCSHHELHDGPEPPTELSCLQATFGLNSQVRTQGQKRI